MTFWQGKKVFLTGHTGFKGSWLALWLQQLGANVTGFSLPPPTEPNLFTMAEIERGMTSIIADIRDFNVLKDAIASAQPEIVIHMAAQSLVRASYRDPIETYSTNVMGTVNILEAIRRVECVKVVINVTTDKCYENKEWHWGYRENDRLGGHDPYSNSKACAELVTEAYRDSFFGLENKVGVATVRAGNVIGGGDWAEDRLVPDIIMGCMAKRPVPIRNPNSVRPWQFVLEPLSGYLQLAEKLYVAPSQFAEGWNFGPEQDDIKSVRWIADTIVRLWDKDEASWVVDGTDHPHEANYLRLDCSKAKSFLNWEPHWNLDKGLEKTVEWYRAYQNKENLRDVTLAQITEFSA